MPYLVFGILYACLDVVLGSLLAAHPDLRAVVSTGLQLVLSLGVLVVVARRRRGWEGTHRVFWDAFAVGMLMWSIGEVGFTWTAVTQPHREWVQWHTMFSLCGGMGPMIALLARPYLGTRKQSAVSVGVDLVSYSVLVGFLCAYLVMVPSIVPAGGPSSQDALLTLVQIHRFILVAGLAWGCWAARHTPWRQTYRLLTGGAAVGFVLRLATSGAISRDTYHEGSIYDLAWLVPFYCYLWAAREAPLSRASADEDAPAGGAWQTAVVAAAPALLIPLIGFGLLWVQPIGEQANSIRLLVTLLATVAGLGLLTLRLSLESGELQRVDARMRLLAAATEQTADLILITRGNGGFEHANDACVQAMGYTRGELAHMMLGDLLERGFERMVDHIGTEVRQKGIWRGTLIQRRKDGTTFPSSSTVVPLRNREGRVTHFVGVQRDITDELRLRDQLVHSERLSAVGELIAGVAHEINNPLQTIIGCVELLMEEQPQGAANRDLALVRQEAGRAGQIVRNLLSFVRHSAPDRSPADLNQIARATARLREHYLAQRNIILQLEAHPGVLPVLVNREEIQQVVLNLVLNAEHAIGDHAGVITIRTNSGEHAHTLEVIDDGPGISAELRGRVFEPFFTTKQVGQGTGLGLSIAMGIAQAHGGSLSLGPVSRGAAAADARPGACFVLTLPAHTTVAAEPDGGSGSRHVAPEGRRRVLIIEDEESIRSLLARLMTRRNYEVTAAASCAEAEAAAQVGEFDLVLCDVALGDGNGGDCIRALRRIQPAIGRRVVFVTGDAGSVRGINEDLEDAVVLPKPFTATDLDRVLGDVEVGV